jgi:3-oxoacyl-[acyl-carrier protein] reductase
MNDKKSLVVISGGMGGVGKRLAQRLATEGMIVCLLYYSQDKNVVDAFLETLPGDGHLAFSCDIRDAHATARLIATIEETHGAVEVCIHAAVPKLVRQHASTITPAEFAEQFSVTVFGALHLFQSVAEYMRERKTGVLIGFTTKAIEAGAAPTKMAGYVCAKYALRGLLRELYFDLAKDGIRVNAIAPDFLDTGLHSDLPRLVVDFLKRGVVASDEESFAAISDVVVDLIRNKNEERNGTSCTVPELAVSPL